MVLDKKYHYVYKIIDKTDYDTYVGDRYIGVKSSDDEPSKVLGITYFSSSSNKEFIKKQKNDPSMFEYIVLGMFSDRNLANEFEIWCLNKVSAITNTKYINKAIPTNTSFTTFGLHVSDITRRKMSIAKTGKYNGENNPNWGKTTSQETRDKIRNKALGRKHSEEWKQNHSKLMTGENNPAYGKSPFRNMTEENIKIFKENVSKQWKGVPKKKIECPHCHKMIAVNVAHRWHFDNCKSK